MEFCKSNKFAIHTITQGDQKCFSSNHLEQYLFFEPTDRKSENRIGTVESTGDHLKQNHEKESGTASKGLSVHVTKYKSDLFEL